MTRIATAGAHVTLEASGTWLWGNGSKTKSIELGNGEAAFCVDGKTALLWHDVERAIAENVKSAIYKHNKSVVIPGTLDEVKYVLVERFSLSQDSFYKDNPLVTSATRGYFMVKVRVKSIQQISPQLIDTSIMHSGSWVIEDVQRVVTTEGTKILERFLDHGKKCCDMIMKENPQLNLKNKNFNKEFRTRLLKHLKQNRAAGELEPNIDECELEADKTLVREASKWFPKDWVARANKTPLKIEQYEGSYWEYDPEVHDKATIYLNKDSKRLGDAVHEYTHHIQYAEPYVDQLFQDLHIRLNKGVEPIIDSQRVNKILEFEEIYEPGPYFDKYTGFVYEHSGRKEVMSTAFEMLISDRKGRGVKELIQSKGNDQLLYLSLGTLFTC